MYYKVVKCGTEVHLRPASKISRLSNTFNSRILLREQDSDISVDAKNIIDITHAGYRKGSNVIISAVGSDEEEAVESLAIIIESIEGEEFNEY